MRNPEFDFMATSRFKKLRELDKNMLRELEKGILRRKPGRRTRDKSFETWFGQLESVQGLRELSATLARGGLFDVRCEQHGVRDLDGSRWTMTIARAATTDMWPMGTHYWVRDNALIGARFLASGSRQGARLGKSVLMSALSFMSTVSQLQRFEKVVRSSSRTFKSNPDNWPYIFAGVENNLNASQKEGWAHKQDAWQIVAWFVLCSLENGSISLRELNAKHRRFLGLIIPFLVSIDFVRSENSGSWEEIPAARSSVIAWEHRLIVKLAELAQRRDFAFIQREFEKNRQYLPRSLRNQSLLGIVSRKERDVITYMTSNLPFECGAYSKRDPRYREGDGALVYLLMLDYPRFLAERAKKTLSWAADLEGRLLKQILKLVDSKSRGIYRYANDTYQRCGYFRHETVQKLTDLYGAPSGDSSTHFVARERIVPKGRKAAWTHFVWQLAAWSGERYVESGSRRYRQLHDRFFRWGLGFVTGSGELSLDQDARGFSRIIRLPKFRMPECFIADVAPSGREMVFPSPHTPLNWSVGEMLNAFRVREAVLEHDAGLGEARRRKAA